MPYKTQSLDTSESADRAYFDLLRRMGQGKRVERMRRLSATQRRCAFQALKKAMPHLSQRELQVEAVSRWYGKAEAQRLERALKESGRWN